MRIAYLYAEEPSPMWIPETEERSVQLNWVALFSYAASFALSLAIWGGMYQAIRLLLK